jgi:CheY-like chemotaxis protein
MENQRVAKNKILVIEDNALNMKLIKTVLEQENYEVLEAPAARPGLQLAAEKAPDLILMDIRLPDLDGVEATRILKRSPGLREIPVIAVSAYAMEEDIARAKEAGCAAYLTKPVRLEELRLTIRQFLPG